LACLRIVALLTKSTYAAYLKIVTDFGDVHHCESERVNVNVPTSQPMHLYRSPDSPSGLSCSPQEPDMADDEFPLILTLAELRMDAQYVRWMIALKGDEERPAREQLLRTLEERITVLESKIRHRAPSDTLVNGL
jgi:hypothetical protein